MSDLAAFLDRNPKQHIIFDFDQTLFTLDLPWGDYLDTTYELLKNHNDEFYTEHSDKNATNYELLNAFVRAGMPEIRATADEYACTFETEELDGVTEHPEITTFIRTNAGNYQFYIWTSNCSKGVRRVLEENKLWQDESGKPYFQVLVSRDTVAYFKPNPDGFSQIADYAAKTAEANNQAQPQLSEFLMVVDSNSDKGAAEAAGIDFFRV